MDLASLPLHEARAHLLARAAAPDQWMLRRKQNSVGGARPLKRNLPATEPVIAKLQAAGDARKQGRHTQASAMFKAAVSEISDRPGTPMAVLGDAQSGLAVTCQEMGLWEQARKSYMAAIDAFQHAGTHEHADALVTLYNNIAMTCRELGDCEEAELAYVTAIELHESHLPHEHAESLTSLYGNLAYLYHDQGLSNEAHEVQSFAVSILERFSPGDHSGIVQGLRRAGVFAASAGRHNEAIECYSDARRRLTADNSPPPRLLCDLWVSEAVSRHALGQTEECLRLYSHAMEHLDTPSYRDDILLATLQNNVGCIHLGAGHLEEASMILTQAQGLLKRHPAADVGVRAEVLHNLAIVYEKMEQQEAAASFRDASKNLLQFVSQDLRLKLTHAEQQQLALPADTTVKVHRSEAYVALPVCLVSHKERAMAAMVIPLTTETLTWEAKPSA
jgi:tetratricopeptide (TPR) repeat protein